MKFQDRQTESASRLLQLADKKKESTSERDSSVHLILLSNIEIKHASRAKRDNRDKENERLIHRKKKHHPALAIRQGGPKTSLTG